MDYQLKFEKDFDLLRTDAMKFLNKKHDYVKAYNKAIQANFIAENYLGDKEKVIESKLIIGLAYLVIDQIKGHKMLQNLYFDNLRYFKLNDRLNLRMKTALARAKRLNGEYDEAIGMIQEIIKYVQDKPSIVKNVYENQDQGIVACFNEITCSLIYKSWQSKYFLSVEKIEKELIGKTEIEKEDIVKKMILRDDGEHTDVINEAKSNAKETMKRSKALNPSDVLNIVTSANLACVLIEIKELDEAYKIFSKLAKNPYVIENFLASVFNEIALIKTYQKEYGIAKEYLDRAWEWLMSKNNIMELSRNCYIQALNYIKLGNLDLGYACADFGYKQNGDYNCLELLYKISLLKSIISKRLGNESEFVFYSYQHQTYKNNVRSVG
ncbi:MAG: hypothetical protein KAX49_16935 [Halanaerobiales bacterium]|nr:hypothetical protein [Halanaerobiales bacterium]